MPHYGEPRDIISKLVNISCASIKIKELILKEPHGDFSLRPQMHFIILSEPGNIKSTVISEIARVHNITPYASVTFPGLVGTVYKTGKKPITGCAWESRNKIMLLDEFNPKEETMIALLRVLEDQQYKRQLGTGKETKTNLHDDDLYYMVKNGVIELKTRTSCVLGSMMYLEYSTRKSTQALLTRCVPYRFKPTIEELREISMGKKLYTHDNINPIFTENDKHCIVIQENDYVSIVDFVMKEKVDNQIFMRAIGDCCRCFAVLGKHDYDLYNIICKLKQRAMNCYNVMINIENEQREKIDKYADKSD